MSPAWSAGRLGRRAAVAVVLAALMILSACAGHPARPADAPAKRTAPGKPSSATPAAGTRVLGIPGHYRVGEREETFIEPAHRGPAGEYLGPRTLVTDIRYPLASAAAGSAAAGSAAAGSQPGRPPPGRPPPGRSRVGRRRVAAGARAVAAPGVRPRVPSVQRLVCASPAGLGQRRLSGRGRGFPPHELSCRRALRT